MEFYELIEKIIDTIPSGYENIKAICETILPYLFGIACGATCFVGHFMHKVWNAFLFFCIGFFAPLFIIFVLFEPSGVLFWIIALLCAVCGGACAYYSKNIFKVRLFITTLIMVYIAVPDYFSFLGKGASVLIGIVLAVIAAVLSIKYKYLAVIATTSFSGALMLWSVFEKLFSINHILVSVLAILTGCVGLAVQCVVEKKELKETYEHIKEQSKKAKKTAKKVKNKVSKNSND